MGPVSILVALSCPGPLEARRTPTDTAGQEVAPSGGRRQTAGQQDASTISASLRVLGIAGSLRAGSYNRALLRAAQEDAPSGMEIQRYDVASIPFYNADVEARGDPRGRRAADRDTRV
jgi:NADPH-dependent FMN reductase